MADRNDYALRPLTGSDSATILKWRNSDQVRRNMYTDHLITEAEHAKWMEKIEQDDSSRYMVFQIKGRPTGLVNVVQIDQRNGKCYWGFYIGAEDSPRGSGSIMEFLALEYIFEQLDIRKLYCEVFAFNKPVIKLHKKFGFKEEGCFKEHVLKGDVYEDVLSLALFSSDWKNVKSEIGRILFR